ncbi:sporulation protein YhbH [Ruminiclostridium cellobioparum]|jgi:sporulation protein YhbH|uniref:sporulation protein YhbH n=1 Tax=Ruminiclostridium cellobioparum TaxID=29355 RepID=UPI000488FF1D|nr:sporulation protein YhbH [Ruminiclostridium cellobioparum]
MAIFRENGSGGRDRSAEDRRRHRELVEESIKKNLGNIIAEESIIGKSRDKKIKIPIRGIKEFQFVYGRNKPGVGSGDGNEKRGDKFAGEAQSGTGKGRAGNQEGEEIYETEITIEEVIRYLFDDLNLPDIDKKQLSQLEEKSYRKLGYQQRGIPPRLAKKRSVVEKIKRKQATKRTLNELDQEKAQKYEEDFEDSSEIHINNNIQLNGLQKNRFPFIEDDLRYYRIKEDNKRDYNAVVLCIMDVSGSMDQTKKYLARSFYFLLYQFLQLKYTNVEVVFIAHTTTAKEVNEKEFFHRGESGGTYISSGYEKALEIINERYSPSNWNIYAFHCSDGDNWSEDNKKAVDSARKLCEVCNLFGYGEIVPGYYSMGSTIKSELQSKIDSENFAAITINKKEDVLPALKKLLEKGE